MKHECIISVLKRECYEDLQMQYLADPTVGSCLRFQDGEEFLIDVENYESMNSGNFCLCYRPICLYSHSRRLYYEWLDKR